MDKNFYKDEKEKENRPMKRKQKITHKGGKNRGFSGENSKNNLSEKARHKSSAST